MSIQKTKEELFTAWENDLLASLSADDFALTSTTDTDPIPANNLLLTYPEIAKDWHPTKNGSLNPANISYGSGKKVWWLCKKGHEYLQNVDRRTHRGSACPYCSGHKVLKGFNDFETLYPDNAKEWHPAKNGNLKPSDFTSGSGKKVWWLCPNGHSYQATISERGYRQANCPICRSRNTTSFPEQAIAFYLKKVFPDTENRYKDFFENSMEFDIFIPSLNVAIEYDGAAWHTTQEHYERELKKYSFCKFHKIRLIRVKEINRQQWHDTADTILFLPKFKRSKTDYLRKVINELIQLLGGNEIDINIENDRFEILSYVCQIDNSLAEKRPDVASKWNFSRNKDLKPEMFSVSSGEIVWWKCTDCGFEWKGSICGMTRKGSYGCPECSKKARGKTFTKGVARKVGSLAETMPEIAKQWHPTKNGDLTPHDISAGRFQPIWWLCEKCGHEWQSSPNNRKKGVGCPCCSGRVPKKGVNDLETVHPEIAGIYELS